MALIVEDGTAKADAESYCTVAFATTYHSDRGNAAWAALASDAIREQLLRKATEYMVGAYRSRWAGERVTTTQALDWPRRYVPIRDAPGGYGLSPSYYATDAVPTPVQRACAELALIANDGALAPTLTRAAIRKKVGPLEVEYDTNSPEAPRYRAVDQTLSPYLAFGGSSVRLTRT